MRRARKNRRMLVEQAARQQDGLVARFELSGVPCQRVRSSVLRTKRPPRGGSRALTAASANSALLASLARTRTVASCPAERAGTA